MCMQRSNQIKYSVGLIFKYLTIFLVSFPRDPASDRFIMSKVSNHNKRLVECKSE